MLNDDNSPLPLGKFQLLIILGKRAVKQFILGRVTEPRAANSGEAVTVCHAKLKLLRVVYGTLIKQSIFGD